MNRNRKNGLLVKIICFFILFGSSIVEAKDKSKESVSDRVYEPWCGKLSKFENAKQRPKCSAKFIEESLVIGEILKISREKLVNVQFNKVCAIYPSWNTCSTLEFFSRSPLDEFGDKQYTIKFYSKNYEVLEAIITFRDFKTNKNFRKDLENWMGGPINIGSTIERFD